MSNKSVCCIRRSAAISHASAILSQRGLSVSAYPARNTAYLLLPVPSFPSGYGYLEELLPQVAKDVIICGGNLNIPMLEGFRTLDFLKDPYYLARNAAITARCAIKILEDRVPLHRCPVLILGWGRIGKCLGKFLEARGAQVTIAARKDSDLAMIQALGYENIPIEATSNTLSRFQVIINTVPAMILPDMDTPEDAVVLELASSPGMSGNNIISARGLPGIMAPEESGALIAETFMRLIL